jgi:hypothetical protein
MGQMRPSSASSPSLGLTLVTEARFGPIALARVDHESYTQAGLVMAKKPEEPIDDAGTPPVPMDAKVAHGAAGDAPKRGGGPKSEKGKRVSARNATKYGVFSNVPVVGDERLEDWEEHLEGMRQSLAPVGHYEGGLTDQAALNRWKRARLDRWETEVIRHQIGLVSTRSPEALEQAHNAIPEDEVRWLGYNPEAAVVALDSLPTSNPSDLVGAEAVDAVLRALELCFHLDGATSWLGRPEEVEISPGQESSTEQVRQCIEVVATHRGLSFAEVLGAARAEADTAALFQARRMEYDDRVHSMRLSQAYVLNEKDADRNIRYSAQLDREFDRIIKHLEVAQRARGDDPSPLVRVEFERP